jgi:hypothetical protein
MKPNWLETCSAEALDEYVRTSASFLARRELIIAAGVLDNRELLAELYSYEQSLWHEGRRAADHAHENPYRITTRNRMQMAFLEKDIDEL